MILTTSHSKFKILKEPWYSLYFRYIIDLFTRITMQVERVAVIGAGPCGLGVAKYVGLRLL